jgi:heat shock protein HslJ
MKNYYHKMFILLLLLVLLTSACQSVSERLSETEVNTKINTEGVHLLISKRWQLAKLYASDVELPKQQIPFITFTITSDKVQGFAGCNNFFGRYGLNKQTLTFSSLGMTRRYCADTSALETEYENMLGKVTSFKIIEHRLVFLADEEILATFEATE